MKLIVCLDDNNGMMFNNRRQSRDRVLIENVLELCEGEKLYTNEYSAKLFPENSVEITDCIEIIGNAYCFVENFTVNEENVEEIIVYKWNRVYPVDTYFNIDLKNWTLTEMVDFEGSSHEKITREIYVR
ncbi:MAG: ribonuclease Z [Clostridia bacterium]|nr:ribonuclease Z [Clostridia bacterium]